MHPSLKKDVRAWTDSCVDCKHAKVTPRSPWHSSLCLQGGLTTWTFTWWTTAPLAWFHTLPHHHGPDYTVARSHPTVLNDVLWGCAGVHCHMGLPVWHPVRTLLWQVPAVLLWNAVAGSLGARAFMLIPHFTVSFSLTCPQACRQRSMFSSTMTPTRDPSNPLQWTFLRTRDRGLE